MQGFRLMRRHEKGYKPQKGFPGNWVGHGGWGGGLTMGGPFKILIKMVAMRMETFFWEQREEIMAKRTLWWFGSTEVNQVHKEIPFSSLVSGNFYQYGFCSESYGTRGAKRDLCWGGTEPRLHNWPQWKAVGKPHSQVLFVYVLSCFLLFFTEN